MLISESRTTDIDPSQIKLTDLQAERLGALSGVSAKNLVGLTVTEISDKFRFQIDPQLLLFRKVCGRVVKPDPISGVEFPVPYATVQVEDTDCSLLGFFPIQAKWAWYFPFRCRREVIASAKTDACGNFCVWIPRWDIDWVVRFRHERFCFPIIFERPSIRDLLDDLVPGKIPFPIPRPGPDPAPLGGFDRGNFIKLVEDHIGRNVALNLDRLGAQATFGASNLELTTVLDSAAFGQQIPPPLPQELRDATSAGTKLKDATHMDTARASLTARLQLGDSDLENLDLRTYIGPFKRCFDVFIPEWVPIIDVPDITFHVTQDTNGDGVEETIYAKNYFQVRWNAGNLGTITIHAQPNARAGLACGGDPIPCGDAPAIVLAGRMPVVNVPTIYDALNGYALRPNRPHPSGLFNDPLPNPDAAAPFHHVLALFGCNQTDPKATDYRILFKYSANGGASFSAPTPFVGLTWPLFRLDAAANPEWHYPTADANGWYPIALPAGPNPFLPQNLLLDWPTASFPNGRYLLQLELGSGGVATSASAEVAFNVDNAAPSGPLTIEWRKVGGGAFQPLTAPCPLVRRGSAPVDLEFRVTLQAAATHLRSAYIAASGCGGGDFAFVSGAGGTWQQLTPGSWIFGHWHTTTTDNSQTLQAIFSLPASTLEGTYSFSAHVASRALNPNGGDGGQLILPNPWEYEPDNIHIDPSFAFSVINAS